MGTGPHPDVSGCDGSVHRRATISSLGRGLLNRAVRNVADPNSGLEAASLIEAVDARVLSAALQQDVMAIPRPRLGQCGFHDSPTMPLSAKLGVGHDIFEECVSAAA